MYATAELLGKVVLTMREVAYKHIVPHVGNVAFEVKDHETDYDVVTEVDREVERTLEKQLNKLDPGVGFHGEEFGQVRDGDAYWLVDPIDGTDAFIRGLPFCTSQLALIEDGKLTLAVIMELAHQYLGGEVYYSAIRGQGAFCGRGPEVRQQRLVVSDRNLKSGRLIFETNSRKRPENINVLAALRNRTTLYQFLASGWELAQIAAGKIDGKVTLDPYGQALDYAPGTLLIEEAGGIVANHGSTAYDIKNLNFIASNPIIYVELAGDLNLPF